MVDEIDRGKTPSAIARSARRDIRTVNKHLQRAREEQQLSMARTQFYRQTFTKHNADILSVIERVRGALRVPPHEELTVLPHFGGRLPDILGGELTPPGFESSGSISRGPTFKR